MPFSIHSKAKRISKLLACNFHFFHYSWPVVFLLSYDIIEYVTGERINIFFSCILFCHRYGMKILLFNISSYFGSVFFFHCGILQFYILFNLKQVEGEKKQTNTENKYCKHFVSSFCLIVRVVIIFLFLFLRFHAFRNEDEEGKEKMRKKVWKSELTYISGERLFRE